WRREKQVTKLGCAKRVFQLSRDTGSKMLLNCRESPGREPAGRALIFSSRAWKDSPACMSVKSLPAGPWMFKGISTKKAFSFSLGLGGREAGWGTTEKRKNQLEGRKGELFVVPLYV